MTPPSAPLVPPRQPTLRGECPREREYEKRSRQRDCPLSGAFPDRHGQYVRKGRVGRSGGRSAPCTSASSVLPTTADQLAYLPTRLPIFRIADTHLHTAAAAARALLVQEEKLPLVILVLIISKQAVSQTRSSTTNRAH